MPLPEAFSSARQTRSLLVVLLCLRSTLAVGRPFTEDYLGTNQSGLPNEISWWVVAVYVAGIALAAVASKRAWWIMPLAWLWPLPITAAVFFFG